MRLGVLSIPEALDSIPSAQRAEKRELTKKSLLHTLFSGDVTMLIHDWLPGWMGKRERRKGRKGREESVKASLEDSPVIPEFRMLKTGGLL